MFFAGLLVLGLPGVNHRGLEASGVSQVGAGRHLDMSESRARHLEVIVEVKRRVHGLEKIEGRMDGIERRRDRGADGRSSRGGWTGSESNSMCSSAVAEKPKCEGP